MKTTVNHMARQHSKTRSALCAAILLSTMGWGSSCQEYDLDEKLPPNFGSNLMTYLSENDFENYRRLVQDLGYEEALSGVSLKTLFAADDEAFARFYRHNQWGVHSYEDLTTAQKKLLLYSSMLDNSLQIMNLSSTTGVGGVVEGNCMRRFTSTSMFDTVPYVRSQDMPDNSAAWRYYRLEGKDIRCLKDASYVPMIFFVETFLRNNKITDEDVNFMFNNVIQRQSGETYVNGIKVEEGNIRSANGFIHRMGDVLTPLDNMAEILRKKKNVSTYSRMVERYSAPRDLGREATTRFNNEYHTEIDTLFCWSYFSERSVDGDPFRTQADGTAVEATLKFDPGWNSFYSDDPNAISMTVAVQENMGVMLVPSNEALDEYWNNGPGQVLKDYYGVWDNVPDRVLVKLINNNMLNSWIASVPSKFDEIVNSTQDKMGIRPEDVDSVWLGCNGAIYLTNKVFSPTEYVSVSFPALINETMSVFNWAIEQYQYGSYLNSLDAYYSLFIPTNEALLTYIDPVSYGETETRIWKFHYSPNEMAAEDKVWASIWNYDVATGTVGDSIGYKKGKAALEKRLVDILDNHIVVGNVESGREFYRTKNGGVVRVIREGNQIKAVQNSMQMELGQEVPVKRVYDQSKDGNGKTYILDNAPLLTTNRSVCDILESDPRTALFFQLLQGSELFETARRGASVASKTGNIASFNNYHYTAYIPTSESIQKLIDDGTLKTWDDISAMEESGAFPESVIKKAKDDLNAFLRYHFQDNSLYLGMDFANDGGSNTFTRNYETAIMNEETQKFYTIKVEMQDNGIQITDLMGNTRRVLTESGFYNLSAREYQISGGNYLDKNLSTSAFAVVHLIDAPLFFK